VIPNFKNKYNSKSITTAKDALNYLEKYEGFKRPKPIPKGAILSFASSERNQFLSNYRFKQIKGIYKNTFLVKDNDSNKAIIVAGLKAGSSHAAMRIENLIALGIKQFIVIGTCGSIQDFLKPGDIVVCNKAIRDEGVSYHYLKSSKYVSPSSKLTSKIESKLLEKKISYFKGPTWTIDAAFRETEAEVKHYSKEGVLTVEMEAASLFAVAKYHKVDIAATFVVSDLVLDEWHPHFHNKNVSNNLGLLHNIAGEILFNR
jgi:uridine phosphorylase